MIELAEHSTIYTYYTTIIILYRGILYILKITSFLFALSPSRTCGVNPSETTMFVNQNDRVSFYNVARRKKTRKIIHQTYIILCSLLYRNTQKKKSGYINLIKTMGISFYNCSGFFQYC